MDAVRSTRWPGRFLIGALILLIGFFSVSAGEKAFSANASGTAITWAQFNVPVSAMQRALKADIQTHATAAPVRFVDALAYLSAEYGGNWKRYRAADLDALVEARRSGQTMETLTQNLKSYPYFDKVYQGALGNAVGEYATGAGGNYTEHYGLKLFSPIAAGYSYQHYRDFGDSRSFGFSRRHLGNDLLGSVGTPICAVEGGVVEELGWNQYGGWRIGIRSFDKERYYYYAHLRKGHPFRTGLTKGEVVQAGEVIGYLGMTGYSTKEDVNGMTKPHLHFGLELVFDNAPRESNNELWIDVYNLVNFLGQNRSRVVRDGKDYTASADFLDLDYLLYYD